MRKERCEEVNALGFYFFGCVWGVCVHLYMHTIVQKQWVKIGFGKLTQVARSSFTVYFNNLAYPGGKTMVVSKD